MPAKPKIYGYPLPSVVDDGSCVSVTLSFPNILEYRAAFNVAINMLGKWFQWAHTQADYQDPPEFNQAVATLWVSVLAAAVWSEDCMTFCEQMIACITANPATQAAIVDMLKNNSDFNTWFTQNVYRITEGMIVGPLVPGDCADSVVAGRAIALVERLDTNNRDFLEMVELGTNDEERAANIISAIPALGDTPVDEVFLIFQDFLEDFAENYNALSTFGRKDAMAREIYCLMLEDPECTITFETLYTYFQAKAGSGLTILSVLQDVISFLADGDFDNDNAIWFGMFALQVGFVLNSRDFYGVDIGTISGAMRDALPSSRWEDWDPCEPPPVGECIDFTEEVGTWFAGDFAGTPSDYWGIWHLGQGLGPGTPDNGFYWHRPKPMTDVYADEVTFTFDSAVTNFWFVQKSYAVMLQYEGAATTSITFSAATHPTLFPIDLGGQDWVARFATELIDPGIRLASFCYVASE